MVKFFQAAKDNIATQVTGVLNSLGKIANVAINHPTEFSVLFLAVATFQMTNACYLVFCKYEGAELLTGSMPKLPDNLTEFCIANNPITPPPAFKWGDSLNTDDLCDLVCGIGKKFIPGG